jgi:hypothetical protein
MFGADRNHLHHFDHAIQVVDVGAFIVRLAVGIAVNPGIGKREGKMKKKGIGILGAGIEIKAGMATAPGGSLFITQQNQLLAVYFYLFCRQGGGRVHVKHLPEAVDVTVYAQM